MNPSTPFPDNPTACGACGGPCRASPGPVVLSVPEGSRTPPLNTSPSWRAGTAGSAFLAPRRPARWMTPQPSNGPRQRSHRTPGTDARLRWTHLPSTPATAAPDPPGAAGGVALAPS